MGGAKGGSGGLNSMVKLVVSAFLEEDHFRKLHRILGEQWSSCHSLSAAVRLMEAHGVKVSQDEEKRLSALPEERMIDALVMKMPQQSREQFEHFFLQLSFIASTTTRLRGALEMGSPDVIEEALESAENVGVLPFLIKMAVAQAGQEVKSADGEHDSWLNTTDTKISPLLQSQGVAMSLQKQLTQARSQLGMCQTEANEKSKKVLLGLAGGNDVALLSSVSSTWHEYVKRIKKENEIRVQYEAEIIAAEKRLDDYIDAQMKNVRAVLMRDVSETQEKLIELCFNTFKEEVEQNKFAKENKAGIEAMDAKLKSMAANQAGNAKKVLLKMNASDDYGLQAMCWNSWVQFCVEYKKDKEQEDAVKAAEQRVNAMKAKQKDGAQSVLSRMTAASEGGLIMSCFTEWAELVIEDKKASAFQEQMNQKSSKLDGFAGRNKKAAMSATQRAAEADKTGYLVVTFSYWKRESKIERTRHYAKEKHMKRKQELQGVKGLFKDFASELETNLKQGTPRIELKKKRDPSSPKSKSSEPKA